jgi:hypothetical protein
MYKFHKLLEQAELLFPYHVSEKLDEAVRATFWSEQHRRRSVNLHQDGDPERAKEKLEEHFLEEDRVMKLMPELLRDLVEHSRVDAWE